MFYIIGGNERRISVEIRNTRHMWNSARALVGLWPASERSGLVANHKTRALRIGLIEKLKNSGLKRMARITRPLF